MSLRKKILTSTMYFGTFAVGFLAGALLVEYNRDELSRYERICIAMDQIRYAEKIRQAHKGASKDTMEAINSLEDASMRNLLILANEFGPLRPEDNPLVWSIKRYSQEYSITIPPEVRKICDRVQPEPPRTCSVKE